MSYNLKTLAKIWRDGNNRGNKIGITALGKYGNYEAAVPEGLIIPLNSLSIPDGWSTFTAGDGKNIIGAGSTYSVGASGGSLDASISQGTGSTGSHTSATGQWMGGGPNTPEGYGEQVPQVSQTTGNHSHTATNLNFEPESQDLVLIKANSGNSKIPQHGVVLSMSALADITNVFTSNKLLKANSIVQVSGSANGTVSLSSAGSHNHHFINPSFPAYFNLHPSYPMTYRSNATGGHSISGSIAVTNNIKKAQLSAWTDASADFNLQLNMIGMYESLTPPSGWVLCDGNNGTPDLRDNFIGLTSTGNEATSTGDNTLSISGSLTHNASHNHQGSAYGGCPQYNNLNHTSLSWSHSHTLSKSGISYLPPYYALAFIMKA